MLPFDFKPEFKIHFMREKITKLIVLILLVWGMVPVNAQSTTISEVRIPEVSTERLNRYDTFLKEEVEKDRIPGAVSYIVRKGKVIHEASYGHGSLSEKTIMRQDNIFHIMSMTKPIVTAAFMMLYEEGITNYKIVWHKKATF